MLTKLKFGNFGRLGNQCLQLCSLIGFSKKYNKELVLPEWNYSKYFECTGVNFSNKLPNNCITVNELSFHYTPDFYDKIDYNKNINFHGYFQTEKYWSHCIQEVMECFKFKKEFKENVEKKHSNLFKKETIAISIRRGDFILNSNYAQIPITYYFTALEKYFPGWEQEKQLIIFSDDIEYCKIHFSSYENVYYTESDPKFLKKENYYKENYNAIEQLCLMSLCDDFIISNSTFSWFGAYLGETSKSKIIRPLNTLDGALKKANDTKDYYPTRWTIHEEERIDLRDITFMIPVHYDHSDRKQNLGLNVCMLQKHFDTNIVISEQGSDQFHYFHNYGCEYIKFDYKEFHRTKMLNEMARLAKTSIIVNWDADVFISPLQIMRSIKKLRSEESDVVYPYDGRFARVPRVPNFKGLEQSFDVGIFSGHQFKGTTKNDKLSVGGAVFFNRAAYFKGGGENEMFVAYGPEDVEREVRFTRLGYKVYRTPGILYHMDHYKGPNSKCAGNKYDKQNHDELEKIYAFDQAGLREYVDSWPLTQLYK